jgi:hypothetical protein
MIGREREGMVFFICIRAREVTTVTLRCGGTTAQHGTALGPLSGGPVGRKNHAELRPEAVALARQLHPKQLSLREIAAELFAAGKTFSSSAIASMLEG